MAAIKRIFLMGFMCSGKTRIGQLLAERLGWTYMDTDASIVEETGMTISEIFEKQGEPVFRNLEKKWVAASTRMDFYVISLGGGAVMDPDNWERISDTGLTITLSYPPEILAARLGRQSDRPLMRNIGGDEGVRRVAALLAKREPFYRKADLVFHLNREVAAERVADALAGFVGEGI